MIIKMLVATHKKYQMPKEDIYVPIHVGKEGKNELGYIGDNTGVNISHKNANYCELTGIYWAWKNLSCDIIGLCHYRRYFTNKNIIEKISNKNNKVQLIIEKDNIIEIFKNSDIVLPKRRNYYIETVWNHYKNAHHEKDMVIIKDIIKNEYPEYIPAFNKVMNGTKLHLYNMFIMKKEDFDNYCQWLFDILFKMESIVDISNYDNYQKRLFGFISERLFNVWVHYNNLVINELSVVNMDSVNYIKKAIELLKRKLS